MIDPAKFGAPAAPPRTSEMISVSADELDLLRKKSRVFDSIAPQLDQLQALAAQGFLGTAGETDLLTAAVTEIVLLRQERIVPSMLPPDAGILQTGFGVMWAALGRHLNQPNKGSHQARYDAWVEGVQAVAPAIASKIWTHALHQMSSAVQQIQTDTQVRIDKITSDHASPDRAGSIRELAAQVSCCKLILDTFIMIGQGGSIAQPEQTSNQNPPPKLN